MSDINRVAWLHIYGQHYWHSPATIRGNREALLALKAAIDVALEGSEGEAVVFASDGEGYAVNVVRASTMAVLGHPEYLYTLEHQMGLREAEREREFRLAKKNTAPSPEKQTQSTA
jgi:hypothetical protein